MMSERTHVVQDMRDVCEEELMTRNQGIPRVYIQWEMRWMYRRSAGTSFPPQDLRRRLTSREGKGRQRVAHRPLLPPSPAACRTLCATTPALAAPKRVQVITCRTEFALRRVDGAQNVQAMSQSCLGDRHLQQTRVQIMTDRRAREPTNQGCVGALQGGS